MDRVMQLGHAEISCVPAVEAGLCVCRLGCVCACVCVQAGLCVCRLSGSHRDSNIYFMQQPLRAAFIWAVIIHFELTTRL